MKYNKITKEQCEKEALKYESRVEFNKNSPLCQYAYRKKWLDEICAHMKPIKNVKFTLEKCRELAAQCNSRNDFNKTYNSAYHASINNNWINDVCSHMIEIIKPHRYWTYNKCKEESIKYKTKGEFRKNCSSAYNTIHLNKWYEMLSHMDIIGNKYNKCIYAYEFTDNHVYVGLTHNIDKRNYDHMTNKNSSVYNHINKSQLKPTLIKLTNYLPVKEAIEKEEYYVNIYRNNNWAILNKIQTGAIGGSLIILTREYCESKAKLCKSRFDFYKKHNGSYRKSLKNNWINDFFPKNEITKERCESKAKLCKSRFDFYKKHQNFYTKSLKNNWLDDFFPKINKHLN
jgi:predicted GIY-YIG superfamily endonuclease